MLPISAVWPQEPGLGERNQGGQALGLGQGLYECQMSVMTAIVFSTTVLFKRGPQAANTSSKLAMAGDRSLFDITCFGLRPKAKRGLPPDLGCSPGLRDQGFHWPIWDPSL